LLLQSKKSYDNMLRVFYVILCSISLLPCKGFGPLLEALQKISGIDASTSTRKPTVNADLLLKELNLQASTEPRLAYARIERIPSLLLSSVAPILRRGSGVLPCNYNVQVIDRNETQYTYIAFDTINKQLLETGYSNLPVLPLELYEYESDADSKLVREACSMLSLIVTMYPMPVNGPQYRSKINAQQFINPKFSEISSSNDNSNNNFPYFYDPNTNVKLIGSRRIIDYLFTKYGPPSNNNNIPEILQQPIIGTNWPKRFAYIGVSVISRNAGGTYIPSSFHDTNNNNIERKPILLYAYEGSPFCKVVCEVLCNYEIPHTIYYTPRGSVNRQRLYEITKRFQVPYIEDPNTGINLFESEAIVEYIQKQYGVTTSSVKYI
jgi:hypothetical protein